MKTFNAFILSLAIFAAAGFAASVSAATLDSAITAGSWLTTEDRCGDVTCVVKSTKITNSVTTTSVLDLPGNMLLAPRIQLEGQNLDAGGISPSSITKPMAQSFGISGQSGTYTDNVSNSTVYADITAASASTSGTIPVGQRQFTVTGGSSISTSEVLQVRVYYQIPAKSRLRNGSAY